MVVNLLEGVVEASRGDQERWWGGEGGVFCK